jgi:hypothetical protein
VGRGEGARKEGRGIGYCCYYTDGI